MTKKSVILREAKKFIVEPRPFVCYALDECNIGSLRERDWLQKWVLRMLDGNSSYGEWLSRNHPHFYMDYIEDCITGRLQWMDWMIKYWEDQGD